MRRFLLLLFAAAVLPACDQPVPDRTVEGYDACSDEAYRAEAYFNDVMLPTFFEPYCVYCHSTEREGEADRHGAPAYLNFDDFESATSTNLLTWARVASREMPPLGRTPSTDELHRLIDWLNCTSPAPDRDVEELLAADCPDATSSYADVAGIFEEHCTRCHSSELVGGDRNGAPDGANWDDPQAVRDTGVDTVWSRLFHNEMPLGADPVPTDQKLALYDWLSCGAPD
ncbi:MAG: hypothetical protein GY898_05905 [Proteobacteria bacterium]|nr:hypothetical protein [Pseudomonadota bacterium]